MIREEDLWPGAKRDPPVPAVSRIAALRTLKDEGRLDGEPVIWLKQHVLCDSESLRVLEIRRRVINRRAEIAGGPLSVLDRKPVVATLPFQALMVNPEGVAI